MFEDEQGWLTNRPWSHYSFGKLRQPSQCIRRIGKDYIILFVANLQPVTHIKAVNLCRFKPEAADCFADEFTVSSLGFNDVNIPGAPRCELKADGSGSSEEVKQWKFREVIAVVQDIHQPFAGKVSSWPGLIAWRRLNEPAPEISSCYSHEAAVKRFSHRCSCTSFIT